MKQRGLLYPRSPVVIRRSESKIFVSLGDAGLLRWSAP